MYTHPLEEWRGIVLKWSIRDQTPLSPWILSSSLSFLFFKFHRSRHARAKGPSILVDQVKSSRKLTFWNWRGKKEVWLLAPANNCMDFVSKKRERKWKDGLLKIAAAARQI
jgi:hypothetical protein